MAGVHIASSLAQYAEGERFVVLEGSTLEEVLRRLGDRYPGFRRGVFDEDDRLRRHIILFHNNSHIMTRSDLQMPVDEGDEIAIISAIAGG